MFRLRKKHLEILFEEQGVTKLCVDDVIRNYRDHMMVTMRGMRLFGLNINIQHHYTDDYFGFGNILSLDTTIRNSDNNTIFDIDISICNILKNSGEDQFQEKLHLTLSYGLRKAYQYMYIPNIWIDKQCSEIDAVSYSSNFQESI